MKRPILLALIASGAIALCIESGHAQLYEYATNEGISRENLQRLNYYSRSGQSSRDVRRLLGSSPNYVEDGIESYTIADTVDYYRGMPLNAGRKLIVRYGNDGTTANWYLQ